jgi:hypothetical protein
MARRGRNLREAPTAAGVLGLLLLALALAGSETVAESRPPAADPVLVDESVLRGAGALSSARWMNRSAVVFEGGPVDALGALENLGAIEIRRVPGRFQGHVENRGHFKITDTEVHFEGGYSGTGVYESDPSNNFFTDLTVGGSGYIICGAGDNFFISDDFVNTSTNNTNWETGQCYLEFHTGSDPVHQLHYPGADLGPDPQGVVDNFAWGSLHIADGNSLVLVDGNGTPGGALYVGEVTGVVLSGSNVTNVSGANSLHIYYDPDLPANAPLNGQVYYFGTSGQLRPLPEPGVLGGLAAGALMLAALNRRRRAR